MENKHAFMIMAHGNLNVLKRLLKSLDNERNDIYIHIDAKNNCNYSSLYECVKKAHMEVYSEIKCYWGDFSLVQCELYLLSKATKTKHLYYHLLSGNDYLLKNINYLYDFFDKNKGKEFIFFTQKNIDNKTKEWNQRYHLLQRYCRNSKYNIINKIITFIDKLIVKIQIILGIKRRKYFNEYYKGSQWFSITDEFANYLESQKQKIEKAFKFSFASDEMFVQTVLMESNFKKNLYKKNFDNSKEQNMRFIKFKNGIPKNLDISDYDEIKETKCIFGRKIIESNYDLMDKIDKLRKD